MLDTALVAGDATTAAAPASTIETRPVRMLVRTFRDSELYLPEQDTLRASKLGITRHTTDDELTEMFTDISAKHEEWFPAVHPDAVHDELSRLRNGLAQPRDIGEAREWGLDVPNTRLENWQEFSSKSADRLGWWWVYDPNRQETRAQRETRYLGDQRLIDGKGVARIWCRAYPSYKSLKSNTEAARESLNNPQIMRELAQTFIRENPALSLDDAIGILTADARKIVYKGTPEIAISYPKTDLYYAHVAFSTGKEQGRLSGWYEFAKLDQPGRPKGSKSRPKVKA